MTDLENIERFLKIDTDNKRLRDGKKNKNKNQYYYYKDRFYIVKLTRNNWMICGDDATTRRLLRRHTWSSHSRGYARTTIGNTCEFWHQHYLSYQKPNVADHINNERYDNRIDNLRIVNQKENMRNRKKQKNNTSGKQGLCRQTIGCRDYWKVQIWDTECKRITKYFSITKLGEETAKQKAIQKRLELERLYNYIGD